MNLSMTIQDIFVIDHQPTLFLQLAMSKNDINHLFLVKGHVKS